MTVITSKNIKEYILNIDNDLDELYEFLEKDFDNTIEGIFSSLYRLLIRNYAQNKTRCDYIIKLLDSIIEDLEEEQLKYLNSRIESLNNNIFNNIKKKQRILINEPVNAINHIHNKAANRILHDIKNNKIKILQFMIFHERNLNLIEENLKDTNNILNNRNQDGDNIFSLILKNYTYLNEYDTKEINYFYNVILLFIDSKYGNEILDNTSKYSKILKQPEIKYKEHVIKVIELFDKDFSITYQELEERYDKKFSFPDILLSEINTFVMDNTGRINFTNQECITIDGKNTTCLDDALYIEKNIDGTHNLYIHIADIPSFIPYKSITNMEAEKRIETEYLRDRKISLYPEIISDITCSLLPNNNRNVITSIYHLDEKCQLISDIPIIVKGKINVKYRMTYHNADERINNLTNEKLDILLGKLCLFSMNQKKSNPDKELYRNLENFILFETHHESLKIEYSPSANIIHESMVLNNYGIAKYFKTMNLPYMYRYLNVPSDNFINEQVNKIKSLDGKIENERKLMRSLIDNFTRATYACEPLIHKGHNVECYSHSSSPLRRYADSHGQYMIYEFIFNEKLNDANIKMWEYKTKELVKKINKTKLENENFERQYNYLSSRNLIKKK